MELIKIVKEVKFYQYHDGIYLWEIEVEKNDESCDFWLTCKNYGDKTFMFGVDPDVSEDIIISLIEGNIEEEISYFKDIYKVGA